MITPPKADTECDVAIIGAGPAGLTAALRLLQLGYRVAIIERSPRWPRAQIGEAFTPGIQNMIEMLDANDALQNVALRTRLPTCLRWQQRFLELREQANAAIVDRGQFDAALLALAQQRGATVLRPAQVLHSSGTAQDWRLQLKIQDEHEQDERGQNEHGQNPRGSPHTLHARYLLHASGRTSHLRAATVQCAPRLLALWAECDAAQLPSLPPALCAQTQVEALAAGWLWSSPLPDGRLRVMLLADPKHHASANPSPLARLQMACSSSHLFAGLGAVLAQANVQACDATPYLATDSWQDGNLKLGDAAFALDPISSSGVEKAMRFSLQAVIALHTLEQAGSTGDKALAREFFQHRLIETCARHSLWTEGYYGQAWCADQPFWQARAQAFEPLSVSDEAQDMHHALQAERALLQSVAPPAPDQTLPSWRPEQAIGWHHQVQFVDLPCVVNDRVQLRPALSHPQLQRPVAFLENEALLPHLAYLHQPSSLASVLAGMRQRMAMHKAQRMLGWLCQRGLLVAR